MRWISRQAGVSHSEGVCKMFKCGVTTIWQNWGWQKSKSFCRSTFGQKISPSKMWHSFPHVLNSECFLVMLARHINCVAYHHLFFSSLASCERHNNWAITSMRWLNWSAPPERCKYQRELVWQIDVWYRLDPHLRRYMELFGFWEVLIIVVELVHNREMVVIGVSGAYNWWSSGSTAIAPECVP